MTSDVMKLLSKKGKLSGVEVGTLSIKDAVYQIVNKTDKGLFTEAEIQTAVNGLVENNEIREYSKRNQIAVFLIELAHKQLYADLLLSKNMLAISHLVESCKSGLELARIKDAVRLTYKEYEAYRTKKLEEYYKENKEKVTLFELCLQEIQESYFNDLIEKVFKKYEGQPLSKEAIAFYGGTYITETKDNWNERIKKAMEYAKQGDIKNAFISAMDKEEKEVKKELDKSDFAYDLLSYWQKSDKSEATYKKIITEFKEIIEVALSLVEQLHFSKEKKTIEEATINNLLNFSYTNKELYEKYGYDFLPKIFNSNPIMLTEYAEEDTPNEMAIRKNKFFMEFAKRDMFRSPIEVSEEVLTYLENVNNIYDLLSTYTGIKEIEQLKYNVEVERSQLHNLYLYFLDLYDEVLVLDYLKDITVIKEALEDILSAKTEYKKVTEEKINKARELLNSSKVFKEYKNEFFSLFTGN